MPIPLIPCRHKETGALAEIPESALHLFADFERIDQDSDTAADSDSTDAGQGDTAAEATKDTTEQPATPGRRTSKAATSATTKED